MSTGRHPETYLQSTRSWFRLPISLKFAEKCKLSFFHVTQEHIQLLHDGCNHWFLIFYSNSRIQICDTLDVSLIRGSRKSMQVLCKKIVNDNGKIIIGVLLVQIQPHSYNCDLFRRSHQRRDSATGIFLWILWNF